VEGANEQPASVSNSVPNGVYSTSVTKTRAKRCAVSPCPDFSFPEIEKPFKELELKGVCHHAPCPDGRKKREDDMIGMMNAGMSLDAINALEAELEQAQQSAGGRRKKKRAASDRELLEDYNIRHGGLERKKKKRSNPIPYGQYYDDDNDGLGSLKKKRGAGADVYEEDGVLEKNPDANQIDK